MEFVLESARSSEKLRLILGLILVFLLAVLSIAFLARRSEVASPDVRIVPCVQCGTECACPRIAGTFQCLCPR